MAEPKKSKPDKPGKQSQPGDKQAQLSERRGFWEATTTWQKAALFASAFIMVGAVAAPIVFGDAGAPAMVADPDAPGTTGFLPTDTPPTDDDGSPATMTDDELWSPAVFRMGFGFFLAFAVGYAMRSLFQLAIIVVGLFALALFGLDYAGIVEIRWTMFQEQSGAIGDWLGQQFQSFQAFVTGYLPATATTAVGFAAGLKRK